MLKQSKKKKQITTNAVLDMGKKMHLSTLTYGSWECKQVQTLWKSVCNFLQKLKIDLPYDPVISLLDRYPKDPISEFTCPSILIAALFTIDQKWKQPRRTSTEE